ncbi:piggyBac transposable element-derived protein 4-like [Amphiura filiformis]|uniref:piggyBac transposable element-derived protein 4-like n=1 Tax=Amphiura filiformis TaxID=82378 RepID=UPI003B20DB0F
MNFAHHVGPKIHTAEHSPWEIFSDILPRDAIQVIVRETNKYAEQQMRGSNLGHYSRAHQWRPVDEDDINVFIGLVLFMGMVKLPAYDLYWANNWMLNLGMKGVMPRDRFLAILSFLHCADNEQMPQRGHANYDRLYKVRHVMDLCVNSWQEACSPPREVSFDETVVGFKGTTSMKNYNPQKPHKWGLTVWSIADPISGYVYYWDVYTGKAQQVDPRTQNNDHMGTVHWLTWDALEKAGMLNNEHHVFLMFPSPILSQYIGSCTLVCVQTEIASAWISSTS